MDAPAIEKLWAHDLTPAMRQELKLLHHLNPWISAAKIAKILGIWLAFGILAVLVDWWSVRIFCWIMIGFVFHGLGVFAHEGAHERLFGFGWIDRIAGFFCGLPMFFPCNNYRATHLLHHRYENSAQDPDNLNANFPNRILRALAYYTWYAVGMFIYIVLLLATGPFRAEGWKNKLVCLLETFVLIGVYVVGYELATANGWSKILIYGWLGGIPFAALIANVRGLAEHTQLWQAEPPHPLHSTRSTVSNTFVSFFFNNQNYHLEHHIFPLVPWYNLSKVNKLLTPIYEKHEASICGGYWQYLRGAFRYGPLKTLSYTADHEHILDPPSPTVSN